MGMPVVVDVRDDEVGAAAVDRVFDWLRFVDATFSTYKDESEISRLNRGELALADAHETVREVLERCEELRRRDRRLLRRPCAARGLARPVGSREGLGGRPGGSGPRRVRRAQLRGQRRWRHGPPRRRALPDDRWRVGIQHPRLRDRIAKVVEANDLAVATSGAYARGEHVVDPHTARPPVGVLSVTIAGPELATADAYATAAFAMGESGPAWTARLPGGYSAMTILADDRVLSTPGFPAL